MIKLSDISAIAAARAEKPALISPQYSLCWNAVEAAVRNLVWALQAHIDVSSIEQAVFISENRIELVLMMAAFRTLAIPFCGVDYTLDPERMGEAIRMVNGDCVLLASRQIGLDAAGAIADPRTRQVIDLDDALKGAVHLSDLMLPCRARTSVDLSPRPPRIVAFTSGTSGAPKPTLRTASTDTRRFGYFTRRYAFDADDHYLLNIPLYHVAGNGWARHFMGLGAALYLAPVDRPVEMARIIGARGITAMVTTPHNLDGVISAFEADGRVTGHSLRFVLVGGKNFGPREKARALGVLGSALYEYYGSTETGVNTIAEPDDLRTHPDSVGRAYDGNRIEIIDDEARVLPPRQRGKIAVSSYLLMDGYLRQPGNAVFIDGERFLVTPDRGYLDQDGRLFVLNRASGAVGDLDVYGVEDSLREIAGVRDVALVPEVSVSADMPPIADCALVLSSQVQRCEVLSKVKAALAHKGFKHGRIAVLSNIPYSLSGKVRQPELAAMMRAALSPVEDETATCASCASPKTAAWSAEKMHSHD